MAALLLIATLVLACGAGEDRVIVAAGTTLVDSGLIDRVAELYEETHPGFQISIVGESTQLVLELGRQGAADLVLVHAPSQEREFVAAGYAVLGTTVLESSFVVVGPAELRSRFGGLQVERAFALVAGEAMTFVSRGDGSGTHERELSIWEDVGIDPSRFPWYLETGQGMGPTIQVADQRRAVTLAEYGAFLSAANAVSIVNMGVADEGLANPYSAYVVTGSAGEKAATAFYEWLLSPQGVEAVLDANIGLFGQVVYRPVRESSSGEGGD